MGEKKFEALDIEDVAALLGVSVRMVRNYSKDKGLPCIGDGRGKRFVWLKVLEWYVAYRLDLAVQKGGNGGNGNGHRGSEEEPETLDEAMLRKTAAEASLKELELAQKRGQVVAVDDAKAAITTVSKNIQQKLLSVPAKLTPRLVGTSDRNRINTILDKEMRQLCTELAAVSVQQAKRKAEPEEED